jgi:hypothetical protein
MVTPLAASSFETFESLVAAAANDLSKKDTLINTKATQILDIIAL